MSQPSTTRSSNSLRIANCSGFYGDKLSAAREMVEGGPIDVLTGDYLAELTMAILQRKREADSEAGYVGTFVKQVKEVIEQCLARKIKIVSNAGGLNPQGLAKAIEAMLVELGLKANVAYITGDDLMPRLGDLLDGGEALAHLETGEAFADCESSALTANAYLGAWCIKEALDQGADIVICPRVTDAALAIGPAAWHFNWQRDEYDALAGALVAGHLIECGPSVAGGNYAFFEEVPSFHNMGYPIAEITANGDFTLSKHPGTGGLISVGTVTAQLLYETHKPAYLNPDVIAHFDTVQLTQVGSDQVKVSGCRGSSPPGSHKVCINTHGGYRSAVELMITGLDIEAKAQCFTEVLFKALGGREQFDQVTEELIRTDKANPNSNDEATAVLRLSITHQTNNQALKAFPRKVTELALANYPGFYNRPATIPTGALIKHWPALIDSACITEKVHINQTELTVLPTSQLKQIAKVSYKTPAYDIPVPPDGPLTEIEFGRLYGARSGDKGGCANLGVWAKTDSAYQYLYHSLSVERLKELLPDTKEYKIERYALPNIKALNFYIHGLLGDGIAASTRTDGQAKSLGECLRAKRIGVPVALRGECKNSLIDLGDKNERAD
ncbi:DUF1446 domain-containing protein [SAR92 clade bacterium H231]|nr:DUF1446 domain-containing protein [SAR92 clade bacterium H231]